MGIFRRTENAADDEARTGRILQGVEDAYAARTGDACGDAALTTFEETVLRAAVPADGTPYPPPGHTYPSR